MQIKNQKQTCYTECFPVLCNLLLPILLHFSFQWCSWTINTAFTNSKWVTTSEFEKHVPAQNPLPRVLLIETQHCYIPFDQTGPLTCCFVQVTVWSLTQIYKEHHTLPALGASRRPQVNGGEHNWRKRMRTSSCQRGWETGQGGWGVLLGI